MVNNVTLWYIVSLLNQWLFTLLVKLEVPFQCHSEITWYRLIHGSSYGFHLLVHILLILISFMCYLLSLQMHFLQLASYWHPMIDSGVLFSIVACPCIFLSTRSLTKTTTRKRNQCETFWWFEKKFVIF